MCTAQARVRLVPIADIRSATITKGMTKCLGVRQTERGRNLRTEKSVPGTRFWDFHMYP